MKCRIEIEVQDQQERDAIQRFLDDKVGRATAIVAGILLAQPTDGARRRVLWCAQDYLNEQSELELTTP